MIRHVKLVVCIMVMTLVMAAMTGCGKSETVKSKEDKESVNEWLNIDNSSEDDSTAGGIDDEDDSTAGSTDDEDDSTGGSYWDDDDSTGGSYWDDDDEVTADTSDWKEYSGSGYSIMLSSSWTKTTIASADLAFTHLGTAVDGFTENINTAIQDISAYDLDLESYLELSLEQYDTLGYEMIDYYEMTVNGVEGYYCITSTEANSIICYVSQWFTIVGEKAYIFTLAADEEGFDELEEEVKNIYRTIVFEDVD